MFRAHRLLFVVSLSALLAFPAAGQSTDDWPGFRGPGFDGLEVGQGLLAGRQGIGLAVDWKATIGPGYSAVSVVGSRVVALFQAGGHDLAAAFDAASGGELWRTPIGPAYAGHDGSHDGPIATPLVVAGTVIALGPRGHLVGLALADGKELWCLDLPAAWGVTAPYYGFSTSPLAAAGLAVLSIGAPQGRLVVALEPKTGAIRWNLGDDAVDYQSPSLVTLGGRERVLVVGKKNLLAVDPASGALVWSHPHGGDEADIGGGKAVPVAAGPGRVLLSHTVNEAVLLEITEGAASGVGVREVWRSRALANSYVVPVFLDGFLYGYSGRILSCVDAATGETKWRSRLPGDGFITLVDGHLAILTKAGSLHFAKASPEGYQEVASLPLFAGHAWTAPSFAAGRLWLRGMGELAAVRFTDAAKTPVPQTGMALPGSRFETFLTSLAASDDKSKAIDTFLAGLESFPLIEAPDRVTFLFRGPATDVALLGDLIGARLELPMQRVPGTDLFHFSTRLEPSLGLVYRFSLDYGRPSPDPRNPRRRAGSNQTEHSWLAMPGFAEQPLPLDAAPRPGRLESFELESVHFPGKLPLTVWLPPGYDESSERYPVAYVHHGKDARELGELPRLLDHRVGETIRPLIVVFIDPPTPATPPAPEPEGDPFERYARAVAEEIVPAIDRRYRSSARTGDRASMAAGNPTLFALHAALRAPGLFGRLGLQSTVLFTETETELEAVIAKSGAAAASPLEVVMEWGRFDLRAEREAWDIRPVNQRLARRLEAAGHRVRTTVVPLGWDWPSWKERSEELLAALFPASG